MRRLPGLAFVVCLLLACGAEPDGAGARRTAVADRSPDRRPAATAGQTEPTADSAFAALIARISEPGGFFDTDNLISNETSYVHPLPVLDALGVRGGAYIGVGPDQNFSYIARVRPEIAFIIDIRRDNLLQHLMFKALFELADSRAEYLALLLGREAPGDVSAAAAIDALVRRIDALPLEPERARRIVDRVAATAAGYGVPLADEDRATLRRFHRAFVDAGLDLRFSSYGRRPQPYYPTYRDLLLATDTRGERGHYLAREDDFRFLKELQRRDRVVPVVGDLAGDHALAEIGRVLEERGTGVSALYTSNVEFYLMRSGTFRRFARTAAALPRAEPAVLIRSYFNRRRSHPRRVPGHLSTQLVQDFDAFAETVRTDGYRSYWELVTEPEPAPVPAGR